MFNISKYKVYSGEVPAIINADLQKLFSENKYKSIKNVCMDLHYIPNCKFGPKALNILHVAIIYHTEMGESDSDHIFIDYIINSPIFNTIKLEEDSTGSMPFFYAVMNNMQSVARTLENKGAKQTKPNREGKVVETETEPLISFSSNLNSSISQADKYLHRVGNMTLREVYNGMSETATDALNSTNSFLQNLMSSRNKVQVDTKNTTQSIIPGMTEALNGVNATESEVSVANSEIPKLLQQPEAKYTKPLPQISALTSLNLNTETETAKSPEASALTDKTAQMEVIPPIELDIGETSVQPMIDTEPNQVPISAPITSQTGGSLTYNKYMNNMIDGIVGGSQHGGNHLDASTTEIVDNIIKSKTGQTGGFDQESKYKEYIDNMVDDIVMKTQDGGNIQAIVKGERSVNTISGGKKKTSKKNKKTSNKNKSKYDEDKMSAINEINRQVDDLHNQTKDKIRELYPNMSEEDVSLVKSVLYSEAKAENLGGKERAEKMLSFVTKKKIDKIDMQAEREKRERDLEQKNKLSENSSESSLNEMPDNKISKISKKIVKKVKK